MVILLKRLWCVGLCVVLMFIALPVAAASSVSARSAVVYEPQTKLWLYDRAGDTPRPMASTTKLMTALLAADLLRPDTVVTVPAGALPVEGTQIGLAVGDRITVHDLLAGLLLASGNDCANVLALQMADTISAFARLMNQWATALGMADTCFVTPSGLDAPGHQSTARDMARLAAAVLDCPLLAELCAAPTKSITINNRPLTVRNHNKLLRLSADCIGLKTGFTKKSGRCLVSAARRDGVTLIVVTLNAPDDWNDHLTLYRDGFSRVKACALSAETPTECPVAGGVGDTVAVAAALPPSLVLQRNETLRVQVEMPRFIWAPIAVGDPVGQITVYGNERVLYRAPVTAAAEMDTRPVPGYVTLMWWRIRQLWNVLLC